MSYDRYINKRALGGPLWPSSQWLITRAASTLEQFHDQVDKYIAQGGEVWKLIHSFCFYTGMTHCALERFPACTILEFARILVGLTHNYAAKPKMFAPLLMAYPNARLVPDQETVEVIFRFLLERTPRDKLRRFLMSRELYRRTRFHKDAKTAITEDLYLPASQELLYQTALHVPEVFYLAHHGTVTISYSFMAKISWSWQGEETGVPEDADLRERQTTATRLIRNMASGIDEFYAYTIAHRRSMFLWKHWLQAFAPFLEHIPADIQDLLHAKLRDDPVSSEVVYLILLSTSRAPERARAVSDMLKCIVPHSTIDEAAAHCGGDAIQQEVVDRIDHHVERTKDIRIAGLAFTLRFLGDIGDGQHLDHFIQSLTAEDARRISEHFKERQSLRKYGFAKLLERPLPKNAHS